MFNIIFLTNISHNSFISINEDKSSKSQNSIFRNDWFDRNSHPHFLRFLQFNPHTHSYIHWTPLKWKHNAGRINAGSAFEAAREWKRGKKRKKKKIPGWKMARFVPGKWRGGVAHCYPLSFAVKANITVIRGNCGRTNREPAKEGRRR